MRTYQQLTHGQRYHISALLKARHNQTDIADIIQVHKSTVCRELRRNRGLKGYRPKQSHQLALNRHKKARYCKEACTWILIEALFCQEWSLEQVSDWLKDNYGFQISHEWIYQYILMDKHSGEDLHRHLRDRKNIEFASALCTHTRFNQNPFLLKQSPPPIQREYRSYQS